MIRYKSELAELLHKTIKDEVSLSDIQSLIEKPQKKDMGDLALPCFQFAKSMRLAPQKIAIELTEKLNPLLKNTAFSHATAMGPYVNIFLSTESTWQICQEALLEAENYGQTDFGKGKKILLEYSSPNVAKPLHIGHFRNTMIGQSLNNIFKLSGHEVISINHLGDWGSQFGKIALAWQKYGNEEELKTDPIKYLTSLYVKFYEESQENPALNDEARLLFKKIEEKDPELTEIWTRFCKISITELEKIYNRLGVKFDHYWGESFYIEKIDPLLADLKAKKLLVESEGAQVVDLEEFNMPPCLLITGDGTTLYAARDITAALYRMEHFNFDESLYVVGSEQTLHFKQFLKVLELYKPEYKDKYEHIKYGMYRFKDGKFSTRAGKIVLLTEVVDEATKKVAEIIESKNPNISDKESVAEIVGMGAVIFNDLSTDRVKDVEFDWQRILDFEGDTGPYLQYTYVRAQAILRSAKENGDDINFDKPVKASDPAISESKHCQQLLKSMGHFPEIVIKAAETRKPSLIANFTIELAKNFNGFYRNIKVLDSQLSAEHRRERLAVVAASSQVLKNALRALCINTPAEM